MCAHARCLSRQDAGGRLKQFSTEFRWVSISFFFQAEFQMLFLVFLSSSSLFMPKSWFQSSLYNVHCTAHFVRLLSTVYQFNFVIDAQPRPVHSLFQLLFLSYSFLLACSVISTFINFIHSLFRIFNFRITFIMHYQPAIKQEWLVGTKYFKNRMRKTLLPFRSMKVEVNWLVFEIKTLTR